MVGNTCQPVGEAGARVNIVEFGRGDERIHGCCALTAAITSHEGGQYSTPIDTPASPEDVLRFWPIDKKLGQVRNDGPELIEPLVPAELPLLQAPCRQKGRPARRPLSDVASTVQVAAGRCSAQSLLPSGSRM
jgi:hypothetical protein